MAAPEPPGTASPKNIKVNGKYNSDTAPSQRCNIFFLNYFLFVLYILKIVFRKIIIKIFYGIVYFFL